ncbi:TetR family transcriptional regulator [Amycolatopsis sp. BJA-103]|uniref:TetR family transcriptional regulator n=1 Tax=unclassified Amycolatopsis TaxID=2618356 RepID=UPI000C77F2FA|nr:TetR family transcriptional regulator [Amycolatopsis sp. BJA-103]AUI58824.1 TetR family transcriptional regulator [Amycolatopsis sp. BJA-103]PNE17724.1 TetR family transcriptional regulator [Amycolatopsis sp. BJA-103]
MAKRGDRGGAKTRAHIAAVATELFLERDFDDVTVAEVAAAAGVSKVTVFAHFDRKEDLALDRLPDAVGIARAAIRERPDGVGVVEAFRRTALALAEEQHPLSGLAEGGDPLARTVAGSRALIARLREFEHEIEAELADELENDARFSGDSELVAALIVAAYRTVAVATVRRRLAGDDLAAVVTAHCERLNAAFGALSTALQG